MHYGNRQRRRITSAVYETKQQSVTQGNLGIALHLLSFRLVFHLSLRYNQFRDHPRLCERINCCCSSVSAVFYAFLSIRTSFYTTFPPSFITPWSLSVLTPRRCQMVQLHSLLIKLLQTGSEQFLAAKPCLHGTRSFIHIPLGEGKERKKREEKKKL